jgi:acetate kinase
MTIPDSTAAPRVLAINGGSSSIKFSIFTGESAGDRAVRGSVERIGVDGTVLTAAVGSAVPRKESVDARDHAGAAGWLADWLKRKPEARNLSAIGHRVVHGGPRIQESSRVTPELLSELEENVPLDPTHLPREIALIRTFACKFPDLPQVACFDTAFHRDLPRVAQILPIPRSYTDAGVRRLGFHGLSYAYLLEALRRTAGEDAALGRIVFAHLGSGASLAAVRGGRAIDTSMAFTPASGLVMGTRPGDLDPGVVVHMMRSENAGADEIDRFLNERCGLRGISDTTSDMRDLLEKQASDARAAEAVEVFCYQTRKWIGAFAAALEGLDTLVFSGGIGERSAEIRRRICAGIRFLDVDLDDEKNEAGAPVISTAASRATIRVIATDEEVMIARETRRVLEES